MHNADLAIAAEASGATVRSHLSGLLAGMLTRTPGASSALLGTNDGLKLAYTTESLDEADAMAAVISGLLSLARGHFKNLPGGVRQLVIEHDAASLFVMSAGTVGSDGLSTVLAVQTTPAADPGQVGHEMAALITGLDEHLVTRARRNTFG
ncbi:roadblock/LC7 domain-containing protein [Streptomyces goshikiensis]|uniref:roadblock/LC7 domain-containing protein n=1 Tax=Streptomyces goshikiensis TaxID=1942 RepID=UPI0033FC5577